MSEFLQRIPHLSVQTWIAIGAVAVLLIVLLAVRLTRRRYLVLSSTTAEMIAYHLSRIADSLDRSALAQATSPLPEPRRAAERPPEPVRPVESRIETRMDAHADARAPEPPPLADVRPAPHVSMSMFGR